MLWMIGLVLGDSIHFSGALHGALAFIVTVVCMILAEELVFRAFGALETTDEQG